MVHIGNHQSHSLVVRGVRTFVYSARAGRNVAIYLVKPRKPLTLVAVVGCGHVATQLVLWGLGFIPAPEKNQFSGEEIQLGLVAVDASLLEGIQDQVAVLCVFFNGL